MSGLRTDEGTGRAVMGVAEGMHGIARRKHPLAGLQVAHLAIDRVAQRALQHIDDLFVVRTAMRRWDACAGRHRQLEHA